MKLLKQTSLLVVILTFTASCSGQHNSKVNGNQSHKSQSSQPPEIPENLKKQNKIAKQIYSLQRELRDLKIQEFVNEVNKLCEISDDINAIKFLLERKSGDLIKYQVNGDKIELQCIEDLLLRINRNFGKMSYGFNNAFRMRPTSQFIISASINSN